MNSILIAGCGYVGQAFAQLLVKSGNQVYGLKRNVAGLPAWIRSVPCDLASPVNTPLPLPKLEYVFYMLSAGGDYTEAGYKRAYVTGVENLLDYLQRTEQRPKRVFFVSSTSVYAEQNGGWVDEGSILNNKHFAAKQLQAGENLVLNGPYPGTVVRFSGIYGPARSMRVRKLLSALKAGEPVLQKEHRYTNHIHVADCAGVLNHLLNLNQLEPIYLASDQEPCTSNQVVEWLAHRYELKLNTKLTEISNAMVRGNKRCNSTLLQQSGYQFHFPTFKEGYSEILQEITAE